LTCFCAIYSGIDNGARLRVKGEGNAGRRGAPPGDLIVFIRVKDHPELRRDGIDIHSDIDISYVDAILGSQVRPAARLSAMDCSSG
jgi:molecular chaperone DnaJ